MEMKYDRPAGLLRCLFLGCFLYFSHSVAIASDQENGVQPGLEQPDQVPEKDNTYTVMAGDALSKIAKRFYGDARLWRAILDANQEVLGGNPKHLRAGMVITIPAAGAALANPGKIITVSGEPDSQSVGNTHSMGMMHPDWLYTEGVARAIRREYMTFESPGRIAYLDPKLKEGDRVRKGQVLAYQNQSRPAVAVARANAQFTQVQSQLEHARAQLITAQSKLTGARTQLADAEAKLVHTNTQLSVAQANRMEADAGLQLAQRTFQRYATLLKQKSASQQEYDSAEAKLASAKAAQQRASEQVNSARADINVAKTGIDSAKAQIETAKAGVKSAKVAVSSAQAMLGKAKADIASANVTKKESYLIAPLNGLVARINIEQGYYYSPKLVQAKTEQQLFNTVPIVLIDPSRFEVTLHVPSEQFDTLRVGAEAYLEITSPNASLEERLPNEMRGPQKALADFPIRGRVHSISPVLDTDLRNFIVTVRTISGHQLLHDGENVSLWIRRTSR